MLRKGSKGFSLKNGSQGRRGFSLIGKFRPMKRGFSLVELIVVIAIIGVLVMLAFPKLLERTKEVTLAKHLYNVKALEDTMGRYVLEKDRFPRLSEEAYTSEQVTGYANRIRDLTGKEVVLDPEGKYYDIDYVTLRDYVKIPDKRDMSNYILQNPAGKVFFLEELTEVASARADFTTINPIIKKEDKNGTILISTVKDLNNIRNDLSRNYVQVNDIDMSSLDNFEPIGSNENQFTGTYDGGGFVIRNLKIDVGNQEYVGLFSFTDGATLKNIRLESVNIKGGQFLGALIGISRNSIITNSYSTGKVKGNGNTGGLMGSIIDSTVENSYSGTDIEGQTYVGGLVGNNDNSQIINSFSTSNVNARDGSAGGLVGLNQKNAKIKNSYSTGKVTIVWFNVGGLVGDSRNSSVTNSYYDKNTSGHSSSKGGEARTTTQMRSKSNYLNWDFEDVWQINPGEYPTLKS